MNQNKTIIITGSSGFIGSYLVSYFSDLGYQIRAFQRKSTINKNPSVRYYTFELSDVQNNGFEKADYLIHTAYEPKIARKNPKLNSNEDGTLKIVSLCRKYDIRLIYLSSLSAHDTAKSEYGRHKLKMERFLDINRDLILKPGFVMGRGGGLFDRISGVLKNNAIVPLVGGGRQLIQTLALDDLARVIKLCIEKHIVGNLSIAHPTPVALRVLYDEMVKTTGSKPIFFSCPTSLAFWVLRLTESAGISLPITSENVLGLKHLKVLDTARDLKTLGVAVKDYKQTLQSI